MLAKSVAIFGTTYPASTGSQPRLRRKRYNVSRMCTTRMNQHKSILVTKRSVTHETGKGWLRKGFCNDPSADRRVWRIGRVWHRRALGSGVSCKRVPGIAMRGHGRIGHCQGAPIDSGCQIASGMELVIDIQRPRMAGLANSASAEPLTCASPTAGDWSPLAPHAQSFSDTANRVLTMCGGRGSS